MTSGKLAEATALEALPACASVLVAKTAPAKQLTGQMLERE